MSSLEPADHFMTKSSLQLVRNVWLSKLWNECYKTVITFSLHSTVPNPIVYVTTEPPTYIGTNATLNCSIALNAAVDTVVDTNWVKVTWIGPQGAISSSSGAVISDVTGSNDVYESTLMFSPLMSTANGNYTCEAIIIPVPEQFLLMSSPGHGIDTITTQGKSGCVAFVLCHNPDYCIALTCDSDSECPWTIVVLIVCSLHYKLLSLIKSCTCNYVMLSHTIWSPLSAAITLDCCWNYWSRHICTMKLFSS